MVKGDCNQYKCGYFKLVKELFPDTSVVIDVFCKSFIHNIAKKKYITLQPEFFFNYFDFDNAFLSLKLSPVKLRMCA